MKYRITTLFLSIVFLFGAVEAHAAWTKTYSGLLGRFHTDVVSPDGRMVFMAGYYLDSANIMKPFIPKIWVSDDGGNTLSDISGVLSDAAGVYAPTAIEFIDDVTGWVALDTFVYRTGDLGANWQSANVGFRVLDLHFFDSQNGIAIGEGGGFSATSDGGVTWKSAATGTTSDLRRMFWLDKNRGWVGGHRNAPLSVGGKLLFYHDAVVLRTGDGGASWEPSGAFPAGHGIGPIFFSADGASGWVATSYRDDPNSDFNSVASLFKTTDAGATFSDAALPKAVGTLTAKTFFGDQSGDIDTAAILAMHWDGQGYGHLAGQAYLMDTSESLPGGGKVNRAVMRMVDYSTDDGGATWQKTDLGEILWDTTTMSPTLPANDGHMSAGTFAGPDVGYLVGDQMTVWAYQLSCTTAADCHTGSICGADGVCEPDPNANPTDPNDTNPTNNGAQDPSGCGCVASPHVAEIGLYVVVFIGFLRRRRS